MPSNLCKTLIAFGAAFLLASELLAVNANSASVRVVAIHAMPYYATDGSIRRTTNLFDRRLALRNIIMYPHNGKDPGNRERIEDWDVSYGTTVTYVEAEVESKFSRPADLPRGVQVEMVATSLQTGRQLDKQAVAVSAIGPLGNRSWRVPFFIYGTGCERLKITVQVKYNKRTLNGKSGVIPFSCGE